MRILIINDYARKFGGAETFIYDLKDKLEKKGHIVRILGSDIKEDIISFLSRWYSLKWYKKTEQKIKEFKPDIVHINNCARVISPSPIKSAINSNIPTIMTLHDFHYYCPKTWGIYKDNKPCKYGFGYRCFISNCKTFKEGYINFPYHWLKCLKVYLHREILKKNKIVFVAPSKILAQNIKNSFKINVKVIHNGIVIPKEETDYSKNILFVGRLSKEKGLQIVIDALNKIRDYKVLILGDGILKKELETRYKNINFLGFQDPKKYYLNGSIVVVPSIWLENFSCSVLEAMSYGLCVIGSNIGGIPEQIKHMKTGLLFEPGNEKDFAEKLNYLLKNPSEIKRMGKNARDFVKKNFNWNKIVREYEKTYIEVIRDFKRRK